MQEKMQEVLASKKSLEQAEALSFGQKLPCNQSGATRESGMGHSGVSTVNASGEFSLGFSLRQSQIKQHVQKELLVKLIPLEEVGRG